MNRMRLLSLFVATLLAAILTTEVRAQLALHIDAYSGEVQLVNDPLFSTESVSFDGYSIQSPGGALYPDGWFSLSNQGFPDWFHAGAPSDNQLAEVKVSGATTFSSGQAVSIGSAYNGFFGIQDLIFQYTVPGGSSQFGPVLYFGSPPPLGIVGDYNADGIVSHADYTVLADTFGSSVDLAADGDGNGVVDMVDYQIYQANFGNSEGGGNGGFPGGILPFSLSAISTAEGNINWSLQFHNVESSLAGHFNVATNGAAILSAAAGEGFQDDGVPPIGVPGLTLNGQVLEGISVSGANMFAALGSTLGAVSPGPDRQILTFTTEGALATEISIQGQYGYQGVEYSLTGLFSYGAGSSPAQPLLPSTTNPGEFVFQDVPSGLWFDPPLVPGFEYVMDSASLFTSILDFPTGFAEPFEVIVDGTSLGSFAPGQSVDFIALLGQGVERFIVSGIAPLVDAEDQTAFPLKLAFSTPTASFRMLAVPEPGTIALAGIALVGALCRRRCCVR